MPPSDLIAQIDRRRARLKLSHAALARAAGLRPAKWSDYRSGAAGSPSLETLARLAAAVGCRLTLKGERREHDRR